MGTGYINHSDFHHWGFSIYADNTANEIIFPLKCISKEIPNIILNLQSGVPFIYSSILMSIKETAFSYDLYTYTLHYKL